MKEAFLLLLGFLLYVSGIVGLTIESAIGTTTQAGVDEQGTATKP